MARVGQQGMIDFYNRVKNDKEINLLDCIILGFGLEQITLLCLDDPELTNLLLSKTSELYSFKNLMKQMMVQKSLFVPVKAISVRKSVEVLQKQIKQNKVNLNMSRLTMKGNIIEAVIADFCKGRFCNAATGLILLFSYLTDLAVNR